ncbi:hypothetical protein AAHA92_06179 [Salvia divinorum]|uniref:Uncharacterized protein n=1 Tax=Salvia divinorum TaxID=28513 RepID=A0ABD1I4W8_SALDI
MRKTPAAPLPPPDAGVISVSEERKMYTTNSLIWWECSQIFKAGGRRIELGLHWNWERICTGSNSTQINSKFI